MNTITAEMTVGELVRERPGRSRIFEELGIDYCCGGKKPLSDACAKKGHNIEAVLEAIVEADLAGSVAVAEDYAEMPLDELADHIVATHHAFLVRELPRMQQMAAKVSKVHGDKDERLGELASVVNALADELASHMMKEERILFPVIRQLEQSDSLPTMPFGTIANPIRAMEAEHDTAGNALADMHRLTDAYTPPGWACNTYRALLDGLHELELDLHQHIHKENNILFPRALAVERSRR
ncbi:MAG: iron-sulfur cluster repair di-iron protein [Candidatus Hydrogenedentes bacterium]|nr:iron-sulfur cluster repair di-iron protein [Candidatus Hydrogenedentota bacterium]